jgi:plasmid stabilization system protein ParE
VVGRILEHINRLHVNSLSEMGRPGRVPGTRELIERPYVIVYRILTKEKLTFPQRVTRMLAAAKDLRGALAVLTPAIKTPHGRRMEGHLLKL